MHPRAAAHVLRVAVGRRVFILVGEAIATAAAELFVLPLFALDVAGPGPLVCSVRSIQRDASADNGDADDRW